jgi:hypothetical protein
MYAQVFSHTTNIFMLACGMSQNLYHWSIYKRVFNFYENPLKKQIHAHFEVFSHTTLDSKM